MLYKVTPMMSEVPQKAARVPGQPRKRRKTAIYDADGAEVLITLLCLKCKKMKPLMNFGLRKMADGAIRNQPWCRPCRSGAGAKKAAPDLIPLEHVAEAAAEAEELADALDAAVEPAEHAGDSPQAVAAPEPSASHP